MKDKELINISIKILNKTNNNNNIEYNDLKNGERLNHLYYNEAIKFVFDLVLQTDKLHKKGYILDSDKLNKEDILKINKNYLITNYDNFVKNKVEKKHIDKMYVIISDLCIKTMKLNNLEDIKTTKLYYMLKRMIEDNVFFFV